MIETEPTGEFFEQWVGHPVTQFIVANLKEEQKAAVTNLLGAARLSSDPRVTKAVQYYDTLNKVVLTLTEKRKEEENHESEPDSSDDG
jgi:hypothetical protein